MGTVNASISTDKIYGLHLLEISIFNKKNYKLT